MDYAAKLYWEYFSCDNCVLAKNDKKDVCDSSLVQPPEQKKTKVIESIKRHPDSIKEVPRVKPIKKKRAESKRTTKRLVRKKQAVNQHAEKRRRGARISNKARFKLFIGTFFIPIDNTSIKLALERAGKQKAKMIGINNLVLVDTKTKTEYII